MDKETVERVRREAEVAYVELANLRAQVKIAEDKYLKVSRRFQDFGRQLAMVDGRFKKVAPKKSAKKKAQTVELSVDQIMEIAAKLGIVVQETPKVNEEELIDMMAELFEEGEGEEDGKEEGKVLDGPQAEV